MKKVVFVVFLVLIIAAGVIFAQQTQQAQPAATGYTRGTYTATAPSYNSATAGTDGKMTIEVTFNATRMTEIVIKEHTDTAAFINMAQRRMIPAMIAAQSVNVDGVSGATHTSVGLKAAVTDAMTQAKRQQQ